MSDNKYLRRIYDARGGVAQPIDTHADVYSVLEAFAVTCPARQHAIKKLLCAGIRGKGDVLQDLKEAAEAVGRAVDMQEIRDGKW